MTNILWFSFLAIIGIGIIIYTVYNKRNIYPHSTFIVFYLFTASVAWIGEFFVLGLFNSYAYKTGLFTNIWADNLFVHLLLNTTIYPAIGILVAANSLSYKGITLITFILLVIEYISIKLGVYEHHWWKYYMTAITVVVFSLLSRFWFSKISNKPNDLIRAITFYFTAMLIIHTPAPILLLLEKQYYQIGLITDMFGDLYLASIIIIFSYHLLESLLLVFFVCILKKWYWKVVPFFISFIVQYILYNTNILILNDGWKFIYTVLIYNIFILAFILLEHYSLKPIEN